MHDLCWSLDPLGTHWILEIRGQQTTAGEWNPAMPTHFHIVYGCLRTTVTEVSSCDRGLKFKNIYYLALPE